MSRMKKLSLLALVVLSATSLAACSKTVDKAGQTFGQTEDPGIDPNPNPTTPPGPGPTPTSPPTTSACNPATLGRATSYSIFAKNDADVCDTKLRKRVAAADASLKTSEVGLGLSADATRADLIASHDLDLNCVKAPNGKGIYGRSLDDKKSTALGGFAKVSGIDFTDDWKAVLAFSSACADARLNATVTKTCTSASRAKLTMKSSGEFSIESDDEEFGVLDVLPEPDAESSAFDSPGPKVCTLTITGTDSRVNIANITPNTISGVNIIQVNIPAGSSVVANLLTVQKALWKGVEVRAAAGVSADQIYWNLPKGEKFDFDRTKMLGTIVSPKAKFGISKNVGMGAFWGCNVKATTSSW